MSKSTVTAQHSGWRIFQGSDTVHPDWQVPEPPSWRPRRAPKALAQDSKPPPPLSPAAENNGDTYRASDEIVCMVNAALHLRRPLLVTGGPGTGKSTLADAIAYELGLGEPLRWAVTSRSTLREALYSYDAIGRVQHRDETTDKTPLQIGDFIELGPLGSAMLPVMRPRVLLIDEIDKADIDLPNDLLNILEEGRFHLPELSRLGSGTRFVRRFGDGEKVPVVDGKVECYEFPLVILTSNGERDFPPAFLRRCLQLRMPDPFADRTRLATIVTAHLGEGKAEQSRRLIDSFIARARDGEVLATDQLLNAIQMVMGAFAIGEADKAKLEAHLTVGLGRKPE